MRKKRRVDEGVVRKKEGREGKNFVNMVRGWVGCYSTTTMRDRLQPS